MSILALVVLLLHCVTSVVEAEKKAPVCTLRKDFTTHERAMLEGVWPMDIFEDPSKQARVVHTAEEFLKAVLVEDHTSSMVVFPDGLSKLKLGWEETAPEDIQRFFKDKKNGTDVARGLLAEPRLLDKYEVRLDLYRGGEDNRLMVWSSSEKEKKRLINTELPQVLQEIENGTMADQDMYFAEIIHRKEMKHPIGGTPTQAIFTRDVEHLVGHYARWNWHWDARMSGLFVGSRLSGTGLHVDQQLWSDVGRNFQGYKLVAAWPPGKGSAEAIRMFENDLFRPPLDAERLRILRSAAKITLLRPGDMYLFSGGVAHMALCVSNDKMCWGFYESYVNFHPKNVQLWKTKGIPNVRCDKIHCIGDQAPAAERYTFIDESIKNLEAVALQLNNGGPTKAKAEWIATVPAEWQAILARLRADSNLNAQLRALFPEAVETLMRNKYMRAKMPGSVLLAAGWKNSTNSSLEDEYGEQDNDPVDPADDEYDDDEYGDGTDGDG